jgi:GNAT superfamily N-acetyltransferase
MEAVRLAQEADRPIVAALLTQALQTARTMRGGPALVGSSTSPDDLLERWTGVDAAGGPTGGDPAVIFLGEFHQAVIGLGAARTFRRQEATGALSGRIECCWVEEEARGVGVGTALMEAMVSWCAAQGCADLDALALPGDRSTKQRLEAAGFTARLLTLNRRLD